MDAELTWEILSRISAGGGAGNNPPFFVQREQRRGGEGEAGGDNINDNLVAGDEGFDAANSAVFLRARPLLRHRSNSDVDDGGAGGALLPSLYSLEAISSEFVRVLHHLRPGDDVGCSGGRASSEELRLWLGMDERDVDFVGDRLCRRANEDGDHSEGGNEGKEGGTQRQGRGGTMVRPVCKLYNPARQRGEYALLDRVRSTLRGKLDGMMQSGGGGRGGCPSLESMADKTMFRALSRDGVVKQLAREMELTCEDVRRLMEGMGAIDDPGPANGNYRIQYLEGQVQSRLSGVTVPTSLEGLFGRGSQYEEVAETVISVVESLCRRGVLNGALSTPTTSTSSSSAGTATSSPSSPTILLRRAVYTPRIYASVQRKVVDSFFASNGYLTEKKCVASLGLSRNRMEKFVRESFPSAVLLTDSIIETQHICRPLEQLVQDAILNKSFADLRSRLPDELASSEEDVKAIIHDHLTDMLRGGAEPTVHAAFVEGLRIINVRMVIFFAKDMVEESRKLLVPLVDEFCKRRAREIVDEGRSSADGVSKEEIIPLPDVAAAVGERYPDLLHLQRQTRQRGNTAKDGREISWTVDGDAPANDALAEFCRRALFSNELQRMCARSVRAEVDRVNATRHGVSVSTRTEGAARIQNIGDAFESSFRMLCHLLQIFSKSLDSLESRLQQNEDTTVNGVVIQMKRELLHGLGSCLARLITEYCVFKHEDEMDMSETGLFFESDGVKVEGMSEVSPATIDFPTFALKCEPDDEGKHRNPSSTLSSIFPGSMGSALSQMWSLCSDNSEGGDGENIALFIRHLSDTCLTLVGHPFSVLDKKTEKKVLADRRERLLERIQVSQDSNEVLKCSVVLIYNQVKNLPIAGDETITLVLTKLFEREKKIPSSVTKSMQALQHHSSDESSILEQVKRYALAKNSKALVQLAGEKKSEL